MQPTPGAASGKKTTLSGAVPRTNRHPRVFGAPAVASATMAADGGAPDPASESSPAPVTENGVGDTIFSASANVPRWVYKAIAAFWVGWAVVYIGTGAVRALRSLIVVQIGRAHV